MQAWTKWRNQTALELLYPQMEGSLSQKDIRRCIHIALLCVQEDPQWQKLFVFSTVLQWNCHYLRNNHFS